MPYQALQISSFEVSKNDWLLCEIVMRETKNIKHGYTTNATWRECAFYVPVGTSANMQWSESNSINDWQDRVNDLPIWPKTEGLKGGIWVAVKPVHTPSVGGKQRVRFVKK